jgi:sigma-B regulation protein RsbU (phosphoserine phosphatase)
MNPLTDKSVARPALSVVHAHDGAVRAQLVDRRARLGEVLKQAKDQVRLAMLLQEIDSALERIDGGSFGICEVCKGAIESEYLAANPLVRVCLSHLSSEEQRAIERDLELASTIQSRFLPKKHFMHDGWEITRYYEPAGLVSGDYCDAILGDESGNAFFLVGDVSGKGVAASLLMSQIHAIFRTLIDTNAAPNDLFSRANRLLTKSALSSHFATLVCATAEASGGVRLINAGHCPPLLVRSGKVEEQESNGLPLGLFYSAQYGCTSLTLSSGEFLLFYTDGLTEARNVQDEEYGLDRLKSLLLGTKDLPGEELLESILKDLSAFRGGATRTDDLTLMVIRRRG